MTKSIELTNQEVARWNRDAEINREIIRNLWNALDRKPTIEEMETELRKHGRI